MIRNYLSIFSFFASIFMGMSATAQDSGLDILTIGPGTQAMGLNEAVTAELLGASSLYSNPANLAMQNSSTLNADYTIWIGDLNHTHASVNLRKNNRALAFGLLTSKTDNIALRGNTPGPSEGSFNISTLSLSGGYAYQLGPLALGIAVQYLREEYYIYNASGYAANLGTAGEFWNGRLRLGATLLNLGKMNELRNKSTELPTTFRTGFSAKLFSFTPRQNKSLPISIALKNDIVYPLRDSPNTTQGNSSHSL